MVVICLPTTAEIGITQDRVATPSTKTVHAPHAAMPQPNLVPTRFTSSRNAHSNGLSSGALMVTGVLLMVSVTATAGSLTMNFASRSDSSFLVNGLFYMG